MGAIVQKDASLNNFNTFGVDANAHRLATVLNEDDLIALLRNADSQPWVLGGGSNILLTKDIDRLVLKIEIGGIEVCEENVDHVIVRVGAGVIWHDFVLWAVNRGYGGVENLALIPGRVGAAPIQNIGAYGVELKSVFHKLQAINLVTTDKIEIDNEACNFGYRNSIFKNQKRGEYCITHVYIKLSKPPHVVNAEYGAIHATLLQDGIDNPGIKDVCDAVIAIRTDKLPDPAVLGNSGSFFKNPVVSELVLDAILDQFEDLAYYPAQSDTYKIPAGWLIEQCGWKGKRVGNVGCYEKQALVIVNYGGASGQEILDHAMRVQESVSTKFGIKLKPEVNIF